jgi:hypothetical protein
VDSARVPSGKTTINSKALALVALDLEEPVLLEVGFQQLFLQPRLPLSLVFIRVFFDLVARRSSIRLPYI